VTLPTVHDPQNYVTFVPITDIRQARCCATQRKSGKGGRPLVLAPIYTTAQRDLDHSTNRVSIGSLTKFVCILHFKQFSPLKRACSYQGDYRFGRYSELPLGRSADCLLLQVLFGSWVTCHLVGLGSALNEYLRHGRALSMLFSDINIQCLHPIIPT
jgi:hypothetical protein